MPKPTDLSYYNWETQTSTSNSSPNFQVRHAPQPARLLLLAAPSLTLTRQGVRLRHGGITVRRPDGWGWCVQVIAENDSGLLFKNKRDRKIINVDPSVRQGPT